MPVHGPNNNINKKWQGGSKTVRPFDLGHLFNLIGMHILAMRYVSIYCTSSLHFALDLHITP